ISPRLDAAVTRAAGAIDAHVDRWDTRTQARDHERRQQLDGVIHSLSTLEKSLAHGVTQNLSLARDTAHATAAALEGVIAPRIDAAMVRAATSLDAHVEAWDRRNHESSTKTRDLLLTAHREVVDVATSGLARRAEQDAGHDARLERLAESLAGLVSTIAAHTVASETRLAALEEKLATTYATSSEQLTERLTTHARTLEEGVTQNLALVREAADVLRDGGEDLTSVAQLFAGAVDRYREASDRWLGGLTALRVAAEQAARGDAQDLLGAYLDQTREVFDHSMQFQRQLFVELRQLAGKGS
ncbi:MAG: hypothetical protein ABI175_07250, partial [Polyangiales bacterium]